MHFHLPKPLHGWREFAGEVGIIVLGVLIALTADAAVQDWEWRHKVAVVRTSLMSELGNDRARWEVDLATSRCALGDLDRLFRWTQGSGLSAAPPSVRVALSRNWFWMHWGNWSLATGSQTMDHFPIEEQLALASLYDGIQHRSVEIQEAADLLRQLQTTTILADSAQGRRELRGAVGNLKWELEALIRNEAYMKRRFDAVGVKPNMSDFGPDFSSNLCTA
jgi:hypothetical protein